MYWKPCAITAIVFMTVVSFVGWWYQRRMRDMFATCMSAHHLPEILDVTRLPKDGQRPT